MIVLAMSVACNDDVLDIVPGDRFNSDQVFGDERLVQANLNNLLGRLPSGQYQGGTAGYGSSYLLASITDEARSKSGWIPSNTGIINAAINPTNSFGLGNWAAFYGHIRVANDFLKGLENSSLDKDIISLAAAQARFARAIFYFDLARRYGDVPLVIEAQELAEDPSQLFVPKSTRAEVYGFINSELSAIEDVLPDLTGIASGGVSAQAAIALNARTFLYAGKWQEAAAEADKLITGEDNNDLDLFGAEPANADEAVANLTELFRSHGGNPETILEKQYAVGGRTHAFGQGNWPVRWRNNNGGQTDPTQEIVDAFEMQATGLPITDLASGYSSDRPYTGRDPRFYMSIYYHGAAGPEGVSPSRGEPFIDMEWDNNNEGPGDVKDGNASITGYLVRKFLDPGDGFDPPTSDNAWQEIRFAEVLLIYAEAENEANGPSASVYNAVNRIRARSAMPDLPAGLSQDQMRDAIRHERRIELVFENHRWFDLIRWGIAADILDGYQPKGVRIERQASAPGKDDVPQLFDQSQLTFTYFDVPGRSQVFPAQLNLLPIPQAEVDKFPQLGQNPGY